MWGCSSLRRMLASRRNRPSTASLGGDGGPDHLQGHRGAVGLAAGEVDDAHPALAQRCGRSGSRGRSGTSAGPRRGRLGAGAGRGRPRPRWPRRPRRRRPGPCSPAWILSPSRRSAAWTLLPLTRTPLVLAMSIRRHERRVDLDEEVDPREGLVLQGEAELDLRRPADEEGVVLAELERRAPVRPLDDGQGDFHRPILADPGGDRGGKSRPARARGPRGSPGPSGAVRPSAGPPGDARRPRRSWRGPRGPSRARARASAPLGTRRGDSGSATPGASARRSRAARCRGAAAGSSPGWLVPWLATVGVPGIRVWAAGGVAVVVRVGTIVGGVAGTASAASP